MSGDQIAPSRFSRTIALKDGRALGFAELGLPSGHPCFFLHGNFHSRLSACGGDAHARRAGLRLISVDRPGFGLSDFQPNRTLLDWPSDLVQLADHLELESFSVLGLSGGSGYAYACALAIPERVTATAIVGGMVPSDLPGFVEGMAPVVRLLHRLRSVLAVFGDRPARFVLRSLIELGVRLERRRLKPWDGSIPSSLSDAERSALQENTGEAIQALMSDPQETFRQGTAGFLAEFRIYSEPWGFRLDVITAPIALFHGENDENVAIALAQEVASRMPNCRPTFFPNTGHNLGPDQWALILNTLHPNAHPS